MGKCPKIIGDIQMYFFEKIGIRIGQKILDFGCGKGNYTIPLARAIGRRGLVYAMDLRADTLDSLKKRIFFEKLTNIKIIHSSDKLKIPLGREILDAVFLYDVIHDHYFTDQERARLLVEVNRILKPGGLLSIYPKHIEVERVIEAVEQNNFNLKQRMQVTLIHDDEPVEDVILNFSKS